jgi:hypothetical protein
MAAKEVKFSVDARRRTQSIQEMELPKQAFAMIPISDVFDRITTKLSEWLSENT